MGQFVNAFGTTSFRDDKTIEEIDEKMKELSDLLVYQLRTQNDKLNFLTDNLSSNEQNTILMDEMKREQGQIKAEIEEMKKVFVSINQINGRVENLEKKNIQTESRFQRLKEILRMFGTPLLHVAKNVKYIIDALPRHNIFLNYGTFDNEAYITYLQQERNYDIDAKFPE